MLEIDDLKEAIKLNPKDARSYNNLGNAYKAKGEYDKAIENYEKSITIDPNYTGSYNNLGNVYKAKGEYDKVIECYEKSISIDPNCAMPYNNLGVAYKIKGEYDKAIENYEKSISIDPNYDKAYNNLGVVYSAKGEYDKAIEYYEKSIVINPKNAGLYNNLGLSLQFKGEYTKAIENFEKAINLSPSSEKIINNFIDLLKKYKSKQNGSFENIKILNKLNILVEIFRYSRLETEPEKLYHYTKLSTIQNILETKQNDDGQKNEHPNLRLYNTEYMNDPEEGNFFLSYIYENISKNKRDVSANVSRAFITSLTKNKDEIPSWEAYGDKHKGVAIGIEVDIKKNSGTLTSQDADKQYVDAPKLYKILYLDKNSEPTKKNSGNTPYGDDEFSNDIIELIKNNLKVKNLKSEKLLELDKIKYLIKNSKYKYEDEYRIIEYTKDFSKAMYDDGNPKLFLNFNNFIFKEFKFGAKCYNEYEYKPFIYKKMEEIYEYKEKNLKQMISNSEVLIR
ncbi:tetratricopeptide repeat protein [Lactococcus piscium]|uniref:UDP-N-acetylglucosamine--peptide N-acetylglucosaminyltransferase SPINDLY n=1 Tax=Pseudolactococcus paracarnosus TaxID=2749962 RepID=A0A7L4WDU0_9LACT|nr:tetratricopeptide repeat protein [Lactococcus paracarnosus]MCJ1993883.1 tetratricopeptide repeat protein [Lactococcus paracarnosus]QDJ28054.1 hypothetical protein BHS01_05705 [Lactococcus paracarnosus]SPC35573.1 hypothetical protein LPICM02_180096 [Lactococcus piscium]